MNGRINQLGAGVSLGQGHGVSVFRLLGKVVCDGITIVKPVGYVNLKILKSFVPEFREQLFDEHFTV
jgi:hypothetical protein